MGQKPRETGQTGTWTQAARPLLRGSGRVAAECPEGRARVVCRLGSRLRTAQTVSWVCTGKWPEFREREVPEKRRQVKGQRPYGTCGRTNSVSGRVQGMKRQSSVGGNSKVTIRSAKTPCERCPREPGQRREGADVPSPEPRFITSRTKSLPGDCAPCLGQSLCRRAVQEIDVFEVWHSSPENPSAASGKRATRGVAPPPPGRKAPLHRRLGHWGASGAVATGVRRPLWAEALPARRLREAPPAGLLRAADRRRVPRVCAA